MIRRPDVISDIRRLAWEQQLDAVPVDGEPVAARVADFGKVFATNSFPQHRGYRPDSNAPLKLLGLALAPTDLRLVALTSLDDSQSPALPADVLTLMTVAHAADRQLVLTEREGT